MAEAARIGLPPADPARIERFLDELALVGADEHGGWSRLAFSAEERAAHAVFARRARELGCVVDTDAIGNTWAELPGSGPAFVVGSHLDTVPRGGRFDGAAGVAAALEIVHALSEARIRAPVRAVAFAAEEGARFGAACLGSRLAAGRLPPDALGSLLDTTGRSAWECAAAAGLRPDDAGTVLLPRGSVRGFFELHVEQARTLEEAGNALGLVDGIAGSVRLEIVFVGRADHSGATPMSLRRDALAGASELVLALESEAVTLPRAVATVGQVEVSPGSMTTVPGEARLLVDIRAAAQPEQEHLAAFAQATAESVAGRRGLAASVHVLAAQKPVPLDDELRAELRRALAALELRFVELSSGASHDAAQMAALAPAAMLFVPSRGGASHSPAEWSDVRDIARGADAIAAAILSLDR